MPIETVYRLNRLEKKFFIERLKLFENSKISPRNLFMSLEYFKSIIYESDLLRMVFLNEKLISYIFNEPTLYKKLTNSPGAFCQILREFPEHKELLVFLHKVINEPILKLTENKIDDKDHQFLRYLLVYLGKELLDLNTESDKETLIKLKMLVDDRKVSESDPEIKEILNKIFDLISNLFLAKSEQIFSSLFIKQVKSRDSDESPTEHEDTIDSNELPLEHGNTIHASIT